MAAGPVEQRGDGAASDAHDRRGLLLLVPEGVDEDHGHALTFGQASDCRRDVDGYRRVGREKGDDWIVKPTSLMTSLTPKVLEGTASGDAA